MRWNWISEDPDPACSGTNEAMLISDVFQYYIRFLKSDIVVMFDASFIILCLNLVSVFYGTFWLAVNDACVKWPV